MDIKILKEELENIYVAEASEFVDIYINSLNLVNILIVSNKFLDRDLSDRRNEVLNKVEIKKPYEEGFIELYTTDEAVYHGVEKLDSQTNKKLSTWKDLSINYKNQIKIDNLEVNESNLPKVVSFYSYKGGVGRTAALSNVGYILASRGKKVVLVDMDIEAPGLINVFDRKRYSMPQFGIIDYFNERISGVDDFDKNVKITDIFTEINYSDVPGRLFVVPAGKVDVEYLGKVNNFNVKNMRDRDKDYWKEFVEEINKQVKPDIILVDSRTGLNDWGALSLLNISDSTIFFAYPNYENINGLKTIIKAMKETGYNNYNLVFSRIHDDQSGKKRVEELWDEFKNEFWNEDKDFIAEPIKIFYSAELAISDSFPIKSVYNVYSQLANLIDEEIEDNELVDIISGIDRWDIIDSLPYDNLGFSEFEDDPDFFQKTVYVDKFLDEDVPIISGKKGTGKTKMYKMMLNHVDTIKSMSKINLDNIISLSGHGDFSARPIEEFSKWAEMVENKNTTWENIWKTYLLVVLQKNGAIPNIRLKKYKSIKDIISKAKNDNTGWKYEYTDMINKISTDYELTQLMQDYIYEIDKLLEQNNTKLWIHYDKLDEDLEKKSYGRAALEGLFKLIQIFEGRHIKNIKFKVFIRQDIWETMEFTNKSHFKGRTINLEWNKQDFLKLALKISLRSEKFNKVISKYRPIPQYIDYMDVDDLKECLQILWGIRREKSRRSQYVVNWIYERLTDADENTFPRSLFMLLQGAKEKELTYKNSPSIQTPSDRFLRSTSLNEGLKNASDERCDALRQEYSEYQDVFEKFSKFSDTFKYDDFHKIYKDSKYNTKELIEKLKRIGVISEKEDGIYKFAYIYIDGFGVTRSSKI